jgi:hypothetical protein
VEDRRPGRRQGQDEVPEVAAAGGEADDALVLAHGPVLVRDVERARRGARDAGQAEVRLLVVQERAAADVGPREVREVKVPHAEERELEPVRLPARRLEVPGVVPPLDGGFRVRSVVARKRKRDGRDGADHENGREERSPHSSASAAAG